MTGTCACGTKLGRGNTSGRCRSCATRHFNADPEIQRARAAGIRRAIALDPLKLAGYRERAAKARALNPGHRFTSETARVAGEKGNAARPKGSPSRLRAGARRVATMHADVPPEELSDYLHLTRVKRLRMDEAKAIILDQHERKMAAFRRKLAEAVR